MRESPAPRMRARARSRLTAAVTPEWCSRYLPGKACFAQLGRRVSVTNHEDFGRLKADLPKSSRRLFLRTPVPSRSRNDMMVTLRSSFQTRFLTLPGLISAAL